jgi:hypothetical protein
MILKSLHREKTISPYTNSYLVIRSIGNILGAGLFCGLSLIYYSNGINLLFLSVLTGGVAIIVTLFLIEMNLVGPEGWNYTHIMADIYGSLAWQFSVSAYVGAMVIGPASEIIAAGIILCKIFKNLPLFLACFLISILVFGINFMFKKHEFFDYYISFFKILALLTFCCIGLFSICHLFPGIFYSIEVPWPLTVEAFSKGSFLTSLGAMHGTIMTYGGIESVGFLLHKKIKNDHRRVAIETFKIAFRSVVINLLPVPIILVIMSMGAAADSQNIFMCTLKLIGCSPILICTFQFIIFISAISLALINASPTTKMLSLQMQIVSDFSHIKEKPLQNTDITIQSINKFRYGVTLLGILQTIWLGEKAYAYMFFFSGLCFSVMWGMIALSCSKFCDKYGDGNEWRVPGESLLRIFVLVILSAGFLISLATRTGKIVLLIGIVWFLSSFLWCEKQFNILKK